ncbi:MAG: hexitol phosphatase HxpB [Crocinitomicaceae bacterium]
MIDIEDFEAVIFDMDGVLIDSEPLWKIAMEEVFLSVGCPLTRQDFQHTVGLRIDEVISYWYNRVGWDNCSEQEVENRIMNRMVELIHQNGDPLPGVIETIDFLRTNNIKVGLATSSYTVLIKAVLETLNIESSFDFVHSAENEEFGKPHPAVYLTVAEKLNVSPLKCLVIEDSLNGIISGRAARMKVVCIPEKTHNPEPKLSVADFMYVTMSDLLIDLKKK